MSTEEINNIWQCRYAIIHVHDVLRSAADTLVSLKLGGLRIATFPTPDDLYAAPIVFPALEELYIRYGDDSMSEYVRKAWVLPRLVRLTLLLWPNVSPDALLAAHGRRLQYLHLYPDDMDRPKYRREVNHSTFTARSDLRRQCPELRHVVLPIPPEEPLSLRHPTLRYLDVWSATRESVTRPDLDDAHERRRLHPDPSAALRAAVLDAERCSLPALQSVRLLLTSCPDWSANAYHLPADRHPDGPLVFHPEEIGAGDPRVCYRVFASSWAVQTHWSVLSLCHPFFRGITSSEHSDSGSDVEEDPPGDLPDGMHPDETLLRAVLEEQGLAYSYAGADMDYRPPSDDEESESESGSESGSDDFDVDATEVKALVANNVMRDRAPQLDRQEVLEGFRRGLLAG